MNCNKSWYVFRILIVKNILKGNWLQMNFGEICLGKVKNDAFMIILFSYRQIVKATSGYYK